MFAMFQITPTLPYKGGSKSCGSKSLGDGTRNAIAACNIATVTSYASRNNQAVSS